MIDYGPGGPGNYQSPVINPMKQVYLSLGSNFGDRVAHIRQALAMLPPAGIGIVRTSSFYHTEPVDYAPQPWFANVVAEASTALLPLQLLHKCQAIEKALGRRPCIPKGPRPIDIDILLYENAIVRSRGLRIPHPRLAERRFVLVPLCELAPALRHPVTSRTVRAMLQETADRGQVRRMKDDR